MACPLQNGRQSRLRSTSPSAIALSITTVISLLLVFIRNKTFTGPVFTYIQDDRAGAQIIVQIVSHGLAILQIFALHAMFNYHVRLKILKRSMTLSDLSFWDSMSASKISFALPLHLLALTTMMATASFLPGALWAGALTPVLTTVEKSWVSVRAPAFTERTMSVWNSEFQMRGPEVWNEVQKCQTHDSPTTFVSNCPVPNFQGFLLSSASTASSGGRTRLHSKIDSPGWVYSGRSYGAGSSAGITVHFDPNSTSHPQAMNYTEVGYLTNVSCAINKTSDFHFELADETGVDDISLYYATGYLPNSVPSNPELYPLASFHSDYWPLLAWATVVNGGRNLLAIASGQHNYTQFDQTQCSVTFELRAFAVSLNVTQQIITVIPQALPLPVGAVPPPLDVTTNAMHSLNLLSRMTPSLYVSVLGDSLFRNSEAKRLSIHTSDNDTTSSESDISQSLTLASVEDFFTSVLDDILVAYGSSQLLIAEDSIPSVPDPNPSTATFLAVRIGKNTYIFITVTLNILLLSAWAYQAFKSGFWSSMPKLDLTDVGSVVLASWAGSLREMTEMGETRNRKGVSGREKERISVKLVVGSGSLAETMGEDGDGHNRDIITALIKVREDEK